MILVIALYVACELIANVTAAKPILLGPVVVPAGVFVYALTFTLLDLVNERLGRLGARRVIVAAFCANLLLAAYAQLTVWAPAPAFFDAQPAFARVLGATPRVVAASLLAYLASSLVDAEVFAWWRRRMGGFRWLRVLASNAVSTAVDSALFVTLAFVGVLPIGPLIVGQYMVKMAVTVVSLPLIYLVRRAPAGAPRAEAAWLQAGLALVVALALAGGALAAPQAPTPRLDPRTAQEVPTAVARVRPAVVGIRAQVPRDRPSAATLGAERAGSGVLVDPDGLVLTVGYLVLEATAVEVLLGDGRTIEARVVGHDFESGLGLLRLPAGARYPAATLGRSGPVQSGQPVAVVGMGDERRPIAIAAAVTGTRRFVAYWEYLLERALFVAPQHPAFGGAALVDADGALLGVVSLRLERENLAIPIDLFLPVREALLAHGRPARPPRPWLGVRAVAVDGGVAITGASAAGPAQAAGLKHGDLVVRVNGERVADLEDFYRKLWRTAAGSEVELAVYREGRLDTVRLRSRDRYSVFQFRSPGP
ncbi:MAG: queuosine precursor transporter [Candidatus Rokubacteria bacterium]|nr:queuosine precursor transporter [Candidatus Rokubacteria bacterium]